MKRRNFRQRVMLLLLVLVMVCGQTLSFADIELIKRSEADDRYKWDLTDIYATRADFDTDVNKLKNELIPQLKEFEGKLNSSEALIDLFALDEEASRIMYDVYVYANLNLDLDQSKSESIEMSSIAGNIYNEYSAATSFVSPEILELDEETLRTIIADPRLAEQKVLLEGLLEEKAYILSKEEEQLLSLVSSLSDSPKSIFDKVTIADKDKIFIGDPNGNRVELTSGKFSEILEDPNRDYRARAAQARGMSSAGVNNTLTSIYETQLKTNTLFATARGFESGLEAALHSEDIPRSVYDNLIASVNDNLEYLHKYYDVRKEALGYENLYYHDAYVPLTADYKIELSYDEAADMIERALAPLGDKYVSDFREGIENNWVDVYEDDNKYTGGYQWGSYDTHPFILMNYSNNLDSALTLAHEMGHALNSKYSNEAQPYIMADYPIFTAEVASTVNELLVMDYLIKNADSDEEKMYLINKQIDNIRGTVYVQVMFSEFEEATHALVEAGQAISPETLNDMWLEIMGKYYGPSYTLLDYQKYGWSTIPHFYWNFYVYKYATSMSAAYSIVNRIKSGDEAAVADYLNFLAAGGSEDPITVLKMAGVDMNSSEPVDSILVYFGGLVDDLESMLDEREAVDEDVADAAQTAQ